MSKVGGVGKTVRVGDLSGSVINHVIGKRYNVKHQRVAHPSESRTFPETIIVHFLTAFSHATSQNGQNKESTIQLAIQAIQKDPKLSRRRASRLYNIPESTLRDRMSGRTAQQDTHPNNKRLTKTEEEVIVQYVLDWDSRGYSLVFQDDEDMANSLLMLLTNLTRTMITPRIQATTARGSKCEIQDPLLPR